MGASVYIEKKERTERKERKGWGREGGEVKGGK